jgi:hypothetical protein
MSYFEFNKEVYYFRHKIINYKKTKPDSQLKIGFLCTSYFTLRTLNYPKNGYL